MTAVGGKKKKKKKGATARGRRSKVMAKKPGEKLELAKDVDHIIELAEPLETLANDAGIFNVFDDGGYRTLLMITMFGLTKPPGRLGDDATAPDGRTIELKTINLINTKGETRTSFPGVTTEHTLRLENIKRYRKTSLWLVGVFHGNQPLDIWQIDSAMLEPYYADWQRRVKASPNKEINNPKIPFAFIAEHGTRHPVEGAEHIPRLKPGRYRPIKRKTPQETKKPQKKKKPRKRR